MERTKFTNTNYKKNRDVVKPVEEVIVETAEEIEAPVEEVAEVEEPIVVLEEPVVEVTTLEGKVTGCKKLNVRENPNTTSEVICVVSENDTVLIDEVESTGEWYKVCTEAGAYGFCMKKFIVKQ